MCRLLENCHFWFWLCPCYKFPFSLKSATDTFMGLRQRLLSALYITGITVHFVYYRKKVIFTGLKPLMHWSGSTQTDTCMSCNNGSLANLIQIGQHLGKWQPKNQSSTHNRDGHCLVGMAIDKILILQWWDMFLFYIHFGTINAHIEHDSLSV